jgi:hypothetical protein
MTSKKRLSHGSSERWLSASNDNVIGEHQAREFVLELFFLCHERSSKRLDFAFGFVKEWFYPVGVFSTLQIPS